MNDKPLHYDGSIQNSDASETNSVVNEPFVLTDDMRKNISGNPHVIEN